MTLRPLFVTGSLAHGGAERHSVTLMNRLAERGHECHAVYIKNEAAQRPRIAQQDSVRCLDAATFLDRRAVSDFAAHLARLRPSLLLAANGYALLYASLAQIQAGLPIPIMVTFHTTQLLGLREQLKTLIDRPFFWRAARTIFVCKMQKNYWLRRGLGSRKNLVIHNGVDTEHFSPSGNSDARQALRRKLGFASTDYVIGISAVLRPEKNHLQLLDALASLRQLGVPARLLIIGDGPLRGAIEGRCRALQLDDSVRLSGYVDDVRPWLAACDVTVLCSLSETFSLAALEAMAMGKPVVHSAVGGAAEMIFPGHNGYLFRAGNTGELVYRLLLLAERPLGERMGAAARSLMVSSFSENVMVDRYENVFFDVCANRPAPAATTRNPRVAHAGGISAVEVEQGVNRHENV